MEQMFLLEFIIKNINMRCKSRGKHVLPLRYTVNVDFGKIASFCIRQNEFDAEILENGDNKSVSSDSSDVTRKNDENASNVSLDGRSNSSMESPEGEVVFDGGASLLFSLDPKILLQSFKLYPVVISTWNEDEFYKNECIAVTKYHWDTAFYETVKKIPSATPIPALLVEQTDPLRSEQTGSIIGEVTYLIRLSIFGNKIFTRMKAIEGGEGFFFRNAGSLGSYKCERYGKNYKPPEVIYIGGPTYDSDEEEADDPVIADPKSPCGNMDCKMKEVVKMYLAKIHDEKR